MSRYIKIEWPESQRWLDMVEYDDDFNVISEVEPGPHMSVYVPEDMLDD